MFSLLSCVTSLKQLSPASLRMLLPLLLTLYPSLHFSAPTTLHVALGWAPITQYLYLPQALIWPGELNLQAPGVWQLHSPPQVSNQPPCPSWPAAPFLGCLLSIQWLYAPKLGLSGVLLTLPSVILQATEDKLSHVYCLNTSAICCLLFSFSGLSHSQSIPNMLLRYFFPQLRT